jgi:hypothetical protein
MQAAFLGYGAVDAAVGIAQFRPEQPQDGNDNEGDERNNNSVFNEALTLFLRCK